MFGLSISISWQDLHNSGFKGEKSLEKVQVDKKDTQLVYE